jgi:hypothetical protein
MATKGKTWVVTTTGERKLSEVKKELTKRGFKVKRALNEIGILVGDGSDAVAEKMRQVEGVTDVSLEEPIDIGPPDSNETW